MNAHQRAELAAVLLGGSIAAQMLHAISPNPPWQISMVITASILGAFATWLGLVSIKKISQVAD
jgi:hypothetical protein